MKDKVNHPEHYGGAENPYEAIKVIEAWKLGFNLGNVVKYISRAEKKGNTLEDLKKALWYLEREVKKREGKAPDMELTELSKKVDNWIKSLGNL
jgi:hypothetical protein